MADERRGSPTIRTDQRARFIAHLAQSANVTASAEIAGFARSTAYDLRASDDEFASEWDDALEQATDSLEAEARRRAMYGVKEPVVNKDGLVFDENDQPLYVQRYSDTLMIALLKAHRAPKFNPPTAVAPYGGSGVGVGVPAELRPDPVPTPDEPGPESPIL